MFTGIVEEVGVVRQASPTELLVEAHTVIEGIGLGESLAINGTCLTVVALGEDSFSIQITPETLRRTNLGLLRPGDGVNVERSLAVGGRFGGHLVQGHIEGTGTITAVTPEGEALLVRVAAAPELLRFVVRKGFIAVDGTSLTVIDRNEHDFSFTLIPFTQTHTILGRKGVGAVVNLETDILGRYVAQLLGLEQALPPGHPGMTGLFQMTSEARSC